MERFLNAGVNGPLIVVFQFLSLKEITEVCTVCKSFLYVLETTKKIRNLSIEDHKRIISMNRGCSDLLLLSIISRNQSVDFSFVYPFEVAKKIDFLSYTIYKGHLNSFLYLLENRKMKKILSKYLIIACNHGRKEMVEFLVDTIDMDPSLKDNYPLFCSCTENHLELAKYLLTFESVIFSGIEHRNAISHCSRYGHLEILKLLLDSFKNVEIPILALDFAVESRHLEVVELLLNDKRLDPKPSSLEIACQKGHTKCAEILLADGRIDPTRNRNYCLRWSCRNGHYDIVKMLVEDSRNEIDDSTIGPCLVNAVNSKNENIVKFLLEEYDSPIFPWKSLARDIMGVAVESNNLEIVKSLANDSRIAGHVDFMFFSSKAVDLQNFEISKYLFLYT